MLEPVDPRRLVPRTDDVLRDARLVAAEARLGRPAVKAAVAAAQEAARRGEVEPQAVPDDAVRRLPPRPSSLTPVLNATGVLLHTNLGRAALSRAAIDALVAAAGCTDVELDLATGRRAPRGRGLVGALLTTVPAAADALVVTNNAAALVLAATALAQGQEIVVSRGELVEIGDGFRLPDLLESTGARLREVGTTNRTTLADYADVINDRTGFVLKVHPSNFVVTGFTAQVGIEELATLDVPVVSDTGSGLLQPDPTLPDEPDATTHLRQGAALVTASADKLLGGPQGGLLLGRADIIATLRRHPLARALRVDKLTIAALEATLRGPRTPTYEALHVTVDNLRARAATLGKALHDKGIEHEIVETTATVGGGGAPGIDLPSVAIAVAADLAVRLRLGDPAVLGRVERNRCLLDLRSLAPQDDDALSSALIAAHQSDAT